MKKYSIAVAGAVVVALSATFLGQPSARAVGPYTYGVVEDAAFAGCLNNGYLGQLPDAEITAGQLESLSSTLPTPWITNCVGMGITSIEGAQYLTGITLIDFGSNQISDLSPLKDLTSLTSLTLWSNQISDLSPLSGLTGLTNLELSTNAISDLSPLSGMTALDVLFLGWNQVSDVSPLAGLAQLTELGLDGNQISDVSPLAGLTTLNWLNIDYNQISDVSSLGAFPVANVMAQGQSLSLPESTLGTYPLPVVASASDPIVAVTVDPSSSATAMTTDLTAQTITYNAPGKYVVNWISSSIDSNSADPYYAAGFSGTLTITVTGATADNVVPDPAFAACLNSSYLGQSATAPIMQAQLESLTGSIACNSDGIVSIEGAQYLTGITELWLGFNQITDLSPLKDLSNLSGLSMFMNRIDDVSALSNLGGLSRLDLSFNKITDATPLEVLSNLDYVDLDANLLTSIPDFSSSANLSTLELSFNQIISLVPLASLSNLTFLRMAGNQISDLSPLSGLPRLETLLLATNKISDLSPLSGMTGLEQLDLAQNQISDVSELSQLTNLTQLSLSYNQITDISPLENIVTSDMVDSWQFQAYGQDVTLPDTYVGASLQLPIKSITTVSVTKVTVDLYSSTGSSADLDMSTLTVTFNDPGMYTITWAGIDPYAPRFSGYFYIKVIGPNVVTDPNLRQCIADTMTGIGIEPDQDGSITANDLENLGYGGTGLDCSGMGITSLEGLQYLPPDGYLTALTFDDNQISDLSPLTSSTGLTWLSLVDNLVTDLSPLADLTDLRTLALTNNQVSDLTPVSGLDSLETLKLANNTISDINALSGLQSLGILDLFSNQISDVSPLSALKNLEILNLGYNQISDVSTLAKLSNLTDLAMDGNRIADLSTLSGGNFVSMIAAGNFNARNQQVTAPDASIGLQGVPVLPGLTGPLASLAANTASAASDMTASASAGTVTYNSEGTYTVDWSSVGGIFSGTYTVRVAAPAPDESTVVKPEIVVPTTSGKARLGNGKDPYGLVATVRDGSGNPLTGATSQLKATGSGVTIGVFIDNGDGTYTLQVSASKPGVYTVTVSLGGEPVDDIIVNFIGADVSNSSRTVGQPQTVQGLGFMPGERVTVTVHSTPLVLGTFTADPDGVVAQAFDIPQDFAVGKHTVDFDGETSGTAIADFSVTPAVTAVAMYRIYNPTSGEHFYTSSAREARVNVDSGAWIYEGVGWFAPSSGIPVYRLAAIPGSGSAGHLFTTNVKERDAALASTNPDGQPYWKCETGAGMPACVGWYSGGAVPLYRAFNPMPGPGQGQHNYTTDANEQRVITGTGPLGGWQAEGISWYGMLGGDRYAKLP